MLEDMDDRNARRLALVVGAAALVATGSVVAYLGWTTFGPPAPRDGMPGLDGRQSPTPSTVVDVIGTPPP